AYTSPSIKRIIVAASSEETAVRRNLEDEFVARLKASGVDALPSYRHIPDDQRVDEAKLKQAAKAAGADAALLVRAVGVQQRTEYYPGQYPAAGVFGPSTDAAWRGLYGAPALRRYDVVNSEATLYDVGKNEVVWTGTAGMIRPIDIGAAIKEYVDAVVAALREKNILRRN
ncbi:MAG: hypothetical protein ACREQP_08105, partial [Candidatus Binatia bacterium]